MEPSPSDAARDASGLIPLGRVVAVDRAAASAVLTCQTAAGPARLRLDALSDTVLRIRLALPGGRFAGDTSYALDPDTRWDGPTAWHVDKSDDAVTLRTAALTVVVDRITARLTVTDTLGRVLLAETDGAAFAEGTVAHGVRLAPGDRLLGLGDKALPVDRRGHAVEMWNTDAFQFERGSDPLYKSVPFVLRLAAATTDEAPTAVGLFYDTPFRSRFDLGATDAGEMRWSADGGSLDLYVLAAVAPLGVVETFARLTGRTPMLPRWALGYHQCRYSYRTEADIREVARQFRTRGIPCDTLYFDIHYMDGYRVFTWDCDAFPDPAGLLADLRRDGFTSVVIVDPGVKADDPPDDPRGAVYRDGQARDAFVRDANGAEAHGEVWPGVCAFPDVTRVDVRAWWGTLHAGLVADGVDGIWNDMNEPALFERKHVADSMDAEHHAATLPLDVRHAMEGRGASHAEAHNVYGMQMQRATYEGLRTLRPDRRPFTITRAAYAGSQRFGTGWTGDNSATWDHLALAVEQCLSLNVSGMPFVGADVGGFSGTPSGELLARWTQVGALTPLFRNHSAVDTPRQEPWLFGPEVERVCREAIELRMRLVPYLYTTLWQAATRGTPMLRPLALVHPDDETIRAAAPLGFCCGDALLAHPVVVEGQTEQAVYLPAGTWYSFHTGERVEGGRTIMAATPLDRLPIYVRGGTVLPLGPVRPHTGVPVEALEVHVYPAEGRWESHLYDDAGDGPTDAPFWHGRLGLDDDGTAVRVTTTTTGDFVPTWRRWDVVVHGLDRAPAQVTVAGETVEAAWDGHAARFTVAPGAGFEVAR